MMAHHLAVLEVLDSSVASIMVNRLTTCRRFVSPRSLAVLVSEFAKCHLVGTEVIEMLILDNIDMVAEMNTLDIIEICKAMNIRNIRNDNIVAAMVTKFKSYAVQLSPDEFLIALNWICKMDVKDRVLLERIFLYLKRNADGFSFQSLCIVSKYLSKINKSQFQKFMSHFVHPRMENLNSSSVVVHKSFILRYYLTAANVNCFVSLKPFAALLDALVSADEWIIVFKVLHMYQTRNSPSSVTYSKLGQPIENLSSETLSTITDLQICWGKSLCNFIGWLKGGNVFEELGYITGLILESGQFTHSLADEVMQYILDNRCKFNVDTLADVVYYLHILQGELCHALMRDLADRNDECNLESQLKIISAAVASNVDMYENLGRLKGLMCSDNLPAHVQIRDWMIPELQTFYFQTQNNLRHRTFASVPHEILCYCLASIVTHLPYDELSHSMCRIYKGGIPEQPLVYKYKEEVVQLFKALSSEGKWTNVLLSCVFFLHRKLYEQVQIYYHKPQRMIPEVYIENLPLENNMTAEYTKNLCIKLGDMRAVLPVATKRGTTYVFLYTGTISTLWHNVWLRIVRLISQVSGYVVVEHSCKFEITSASLEALKLHHMSIVVDT
ncbi:N6-adenine-specific methylase, putative [Babesia ovis]|uniref:N6-adenine-specific methylase, putative n=1 Tax=Babesia ovis TaxID=5869 RepID=A0A9W5TD79_BABOV|nr:N6-adenine-specific methylase, putative [Babesia ovis]